MVREWHARGNRQTLRFQNGRFRIYRRAECDTSGPEELIDSNPDYDACLAWLREQYFMTSSNIAAYEQLRQTILDWRDFKYVADFKLDMGPYGGI